MSSTAFGMQVLTERGELATPYGQKATAVLLFQDLAIVPLLAVVPLLAPGGEPFGSGGLWRNCEGGGGARRAAARRALSAQPVVPPARPAPGRAR